MNIEQLTEQLGAFKEVRQDAANRLAKIDAIIANLNSQIKEKTDETTLREM